MLTSSFVFANENGRHYAELNGIHIGSEEFTWLALDCIQTIVTSIAAINEQSTDGLVKNSNSTGELD
jgi:hypothetical protein